MQFDSVVFDLDGTLWDTTEACAVAWNNVLRSLQIERTPIVAADVRRVTGLPHDECIHRTFADLSPDIVERIVDLTATEDNRVIEEMGGTLYPDVADQLAALAVRYPLAIVSNCQAGYIENFFRQTGLGSLFVDIECFGNTGRPKGDNLASVIGRRGFAHALMVGDAAGDETAARQCGVPFAFVTYGFGEAVAPDFRFDSFGDLATTLLAIGE